MDDGREADGYGRDRAAFIKPYCTLRYSGDTLFVATLHEVNKCGESVCRIHCTKDTIHLRTEHVGEMLCTATQLRRFGYTLVADRIRKYHVAF